MVMPDSQLPFGANFAVVAGDEFQEAQHGALVHGVEDEGRGCAQQVLLDVLAEADEALREILRPGLPNLSDVEVHEAHREHVVGEEGELVFPVLVVRLEGYTRSIYALMLRDFPSDTSCQV